jgi:NRPS condensation-like uncharacterized protein
MRYKAVIFDKMQYLYKTTGFNDHQLHCVILFNDKIDAGAMKNAVRLLVKAVPILSRTYRNCDGNSYWQDSSCNEWADLFTIADNDEEFNKFTFSAINEETGPQIKVCLLPGTCDSISIVQNHMVSDAAGFKQCIYLLSGIYSSLLKNPAYFPDVIIDGDRSYSEILRQLPLFQRVKILLLNNKDNNKKDGCRFPMSTVPEADTTPFIVTHAVSPVIYNKIRENCKANDATVNDVIAAAYFRVLSKVLDMNGKTLNIPIMVDMRRYLGDKQFKSLTNLSSTAIISLKVSNEETLQQTISKVKAIMNYKKTNNLGMNPLIKLHSVFKLCKNSLGYNLLKKALRNPEICMTNVGILDSKMLVFGDSAIMNAYMCGSIKYRPHFQMSVSTFNDKMTFCVNLYGSNKDREAIAQFLELMDQELLDINNTEL